MGGLKERGNCRSMPGPAIYRVFKFHLRDLCLATSL